MAVTLPKDTTPTDARPFRVVACFFSVFPVDDLTVPVSIAGSLPAVVSLFVDVFKESFAAELVVSELLLHAMLKKVEPANAINICPANLSFLFFIKFVFSK
jgi:hypothetical protein